MLKTLSIPRIAPRAEHYVNEVVRYGFRNGHSRGISARLESQFAEKFDRKYGILHCNGTATMHSALLAAGVGAGDEVIVPAYTVFSTAAVALYVNAVPIVADVDPETWTISLDDVRRKITSRTKAIIPVSICGLSPDLEALMVLADESGLTVIEDDAQCFLGYCNDRIVGSMGHFASFSFQSSKHMTCGDGGILICDDEELATKARQASVLGYSALSAKPGDSIVPEAVRCHPAFPRHGEIGYNYRLPEIAAAVALAEFERLEELVQMRQMAAQCFAEVVADCDWLLPQKTPEGYIHSCWTYAVRILRDDVNWADFRKRFIELGGDGFYGAYLPVHHEPVFASLSDKVRQAPHRFPHYANSLPDYRQVSCPIWENIQPRVIQLKTNYYEWETAQQQAGIFARTIQHFS